MAMSWSKSARRITTTQPEEPNGSISQPTTAASRCLDEELRWLGQADLLQQTLADVPNAAEPRISALLDALD